MNSHLSLEFNEVRTRSKVPRANVVGLKIPTGPQTPARSAGGDANISSNYCFPARQLRGKTPVFRAIEDDLATNTNGAYWLSALWQPRRQQSTRRRVKGPRLVLGVNCQRAGQEIPEAAFVCPSAADRAYILIAFSSPSPLFQQLLAAQIGKPILERISPDSARSTTLNGLNLQRMPQPASRHRRSVIRL